MLNSNILFKVEIKKHRKFFFHLRWIEFHQFLLEIVEDKKILNILFILSKKHIK